MHPTAVALLLPSAGLVALALVVVGGWLVRWHPLWPDERVTLSEAVALRDLGVLHELLARGDDPAERYPLRPWMVAPEARVLTPFETAIAARRDDVIRFLFERGVRPAPKSVRDLVCLARREGAEEIAKLLSDSAAAADCTEASYPW